MKVERQEIERLLAEAVECPSEDTFYLFAPVMAELCRAWLALDAAPVGYVVGQSGPDILSASTGAVVQMDDPASVKGQRVRLVATPASGGPRGG